MENPGGLIERIWRRVYRRMQANPTWLAVPVLAFLLVITLPVVVLTVYLTSLFLPGLSDFSTAVGVALVALACGAGAVSVLLLPTRKRVRATLAWVGRAEDRPSPEEAWPLLVQAPSWFTTPSFVVVTFLDLAITVPYTASVADLSFTGCLAFAVVLLVAIAFNWLLAVFWVEFTLRPAVEELDAELPPETERPAMAWSLGGRIILPVPVVAAVAGLVTGACVVEFSDPEAQLLAAGLGAVVCGVLLTLLVKGAISDPMVRPVADLTAAAERAAVGELDEPVSVTGGDELGALANTFNQMQVGLGTLRREREELLDEVVASRARIVSASDAERRRVERNLHDGAQQQLVSLSLQLSLLEERASGDPELADGVASAKAELSGALGELRELARGLHPQVLSTGGLRPALEQLAERSTVPVTVDAPDERFPDPVESTAYFVVSEALANVAKYAEASRAEVVASRGNGLLVVRVSDDGQGGADPSAGSGLSGLADRVSALNGRLQVESPVREGTTVTVELPIVG